MKIRFAHINIISTDWRRLAHFYEQVFKCTPVPPERDLRGTWVDALTGLQAAHIRGIHLRLPGHGKEGPTLEIFEFNEPPDRAVTAVNRPGFAHLAFEVEDLETTRRKVLEAGGSTIGESIKVAVPGEGTLTAVYLADPEGNILELQTWS